MEPRPLSTAAGRLRGWLASLADRCARDDPAAPGHWLTRFVILRLLGLVYLMAFLTLVEQGPALLGPHGLLPIGDELDAVARALGSRAAGFRALPSIFWLGAGDGALRAAGWLGVGLSAAVVLGYANGLVLFALCALQISIANVGQTFYAFGWEIQLVETGFLCAFLCPLLDGRAFPRRAPPPVTIWLLRWLAARIMLGAGLIKLRGDACWRDLTCLDFHFETQPIPNPLSPFFHALPHGAHAVGVVFNHVVELAAPFLIFGPRRARLVGGVLMVALQIVLLLSGNLSFLNWLTLVPIAACFDDAFWRRFFPAALVARAERARAAATPSRALGLTTAALGLGVALLSVPVVLNLVSGAQVMNTSFTALPLVNTYGAFGSVGRQRAQLVIEGTRDEVVGPDTRWLAYQPRCQPGAPARRPCWMSPYHRRLDWLLWFAAMGSPREYPWAVHLVAELLDGDPGALSLFAWDPFAGVPPRHVRVDLYLYRLARPGAAVWWERTREGPWLPPLERENPELREFLRRKGCSMRSEQGWYRAILKITMVDEELAQKVALAVANVRPDVVAAYLFGSHARGTARDDSDVDVAVLVRGEPASTLEGLGMDLLAQLEHDLGRPVDLVVLNRAPADLSHRVLRDGRLVLERDRSARIAFEVKARNEYFDMQPILRRYRGQRVRAA
jgi:predicted nucleotidyltransferase